MSTIGKALKERHKQMIFPECKAYPDGAANVIEALPQIRAAIAKKDGLVGPDHVSGFRNFMDYYLTEDNLGNLSEGDPDYLQ